jgi:hypothetical protein
MSHFVWTETNAREQHLRLHGKIVGKILRLEVGWGCTIHTPRLHKVGFRMTSKAARALVQRKAEYWWEYK